MLSGKESEKTNTAKRYVQKLTIFRYGKTISLAQPLTV